MLRQGPRLPDELYYPYVKLPWTEQVIYNNNISSSSYTNATYDMPFVQVKPKKKKEVLNKTPHKENVNKNTNLNAIDETNANNVASTKHAVVTESNKEPEINDKPSKAQNNSKQKKEVDKTPSVVGKKTTVDTKLSGYPRLQKTVHNISAFSKKHIKTIVGLGLITGMTMIASRLRNYNNNNLRINTERGSSNMSRRSAYIPNSYKRGFDEIKSLTTDFGSKVHLDKAASKILVTAKNSTRNHFKTNTNSITTNNLALKLHANAINHTRY